MIRINFIILIIIISALCRSVFADENELNHNQDESVIIKDLEFKNEKYVKDFTLSMQTVKLIMDIFFLYQLYYKKNTFYSKELII